MELTLASNTTSLNYWLTWKFFLCVIWVFGSMIIASYLIWKYEGSGNTKNYKDVTQEETDWFLYDGEAWMPCIKGFHPAWLLVFRIISFCLLLAAGVSDVAINGTDLFFYYTQWTLSLVTFYFAFGSLLSVYGCFRHHKSFNVGKDQEFLLPLSHEENTTSQREKSHFVLTAAFCSYVFQIIFQGLFPFDECWGGDADRFCLLDCNRTTYCDGSKELASSQRLQVKSEFDDVQGHPGFDKQGTRFKRLIKDQSGHSDLEEGIRRLVLCSGKLGDRIQFPTFYIGVTKKRKCAIGKEKVATEPSTSQLQAEMRQEQAELEHLRSEVSRLRTENAQLTSSNLNAATVQELHELEQQLNDGLISVKEKKDAMLFEEIDRSNPKERELGFKNNVLRGEIERLKCFIPQSEQPTQPGFLEYNPVADVPSSSAGLLKQDRLSPDTVCYYGSDNTDSETTLKLRGYVGIHSSGFQDFLLKPELLRAIVDSGFEHPSEGKVLYIQFLLFFCSFFLLKPVVPYQLIFLYFQLC